MIRTISVDSETFYATKQGYGVRELGNWHYVNSPIFDCYLISVCDGEESWAGHPRDFNWHALDGQRLVSHNRLFDEHVVRRLIELGKVPAIRWNRWDCTANMTAFMCNRRSLANASEFLLGEKISKEVRDSADGKSGEEIMRAGGDAMMAYAKDDATRCYRLWAKFSHLWPERERRLSNLTIEQCMRGAQIDVEKLNNYRAIIQAAVAQAQLDLPWIAEGRPPTSPKAIAELCLKEQIPPPPIKSRDGEEAYDAWCVKFSPRFRWVKAYSDFRTLEKFAGMLDVLHARLRPDGTVGYEILYCGAHTARWTGAGGLNMLNMRKAPLYLDDKGQLVSEAPRLAAIDYELREAGKLPSWVVFALDFRSLWIPRPGKKLIVSDLSQIEPRVLSWLCGDQDMLAGMSRGESPYFVHAVRTMGFSGTPAELKKQKDLYALAKARVLGLGYGCGWNKFITVAADMAGLDITTEDPETEQELGRDGSPVFNADGTPKMISGYGSKSRRIVREYRASNPKIVGLWRELDEAFKGSVGSDFELELPSGRSLRYSQVRVERRPEIDEETGKPKLKRVYTALMMDPKTKRFVRKSLYGGLLVENATQATARDVFGEQLVELDSTPGIDVLWTTHDESVNEVDERATVEDVERIMSKAPSWMPGLPVACEAAIVPHYTK